MSDTSVDSTVLNPRIAELSSIAHDGKVVVVGSGFDGVLYYTVRQSGFEDTVTKLEGVPQSMPGFENWQRVPLDKSLDDPSVRAFEAARLVDASQRPIMRSRYGGEAARSAPAGINLVSGLGHLYLFRISTDNRLLANRFVLDGMTNELVPKLEVRYRRSGQKVAPDGGTPSRPEKKVNDSLGFRDIDETPFCEPAQELSFLGTFDPQKRWFSVELLNTAEHEKYRWNFFVFVGGTLQLISVAASKEGLFDVRDQRRMVPDPNAADKKVARTIPGVVRRHLKFDGEVVDAFDTTLYNNQVERQTKGGPQLMKESTRVMLSAPVRRPGRPATEVASVSFAVDTLGMLAQIDRTASPDLTLRGDVKEVLLPLATLEDIKLVADRNPPPQGNITKMEESATELISITSDTALDDTNKLRAGQKVKITGSRSYDGIYIAQNVDGSKSFEIAADFETDEGQGAWEVVEEQEKGLVFENMIASYERTESGGLRISCMSHNVEEGDEIRITGSLDHDGVYPIRTVADGTGDSKTFELEQVWPIGEVVNLEHRKRRGLAFDGVGDYLQVGPVEMGGHSPKARLERTISAWVYVPDLEPDPAADSAAASNGSRPTSARKPQTIFSSQVGALHLSINGAGKAVFEIRFADGHRASVVDPDPLPTGRWIHLAALLDYKGETTGETELAIIRGGHERNRLKVAPFKPLHLPHRNLRLDRQPLAIETLTYQVPTPGSITLEAWVNTRQNGRGVVASWYQEGEIVLAIEGDRRNRVVQWVTHGDQLSGTVHLTNDTWFHIAVTYDEKTREKAIYVNGELDSTKLAGTTTARRHKQAELEAEAERTKKAAAEAVKTLAAAKAAKVTRGRELDTATATWQRAKSEHDRARTDLLQKQSGLQNMTATIGATNLQGLPDRGAGLLAMHSQLNSQVAQASARDQAAESELALAQISYVESTAAATEANRVFQAMEQASIRASEAAETARAALQNSPKAVNIDAVQARLVNRPYRLGYLGSAAVGKSAIDPRQAGLVQAVGSWFAKTADRTWGELDAARNVINSFAETKVDGSTIYLNSHAGQGQIELDLATKQVVRITHQLARQAQSLTDTGTAAVQTLGGLFGGVLGGQIPQVITGAVETVEQMTATRTVVDTIEAVKAPGRHHELVAETQYVGYLGDVRIWKGARTAGQVAANSLVSLNGTERNLLAHWTLEETSADQLSDATRTKAHVTRPPGQRELSWFATGHRIPGFHSQVGVEPYTDTFTFAARLDDRDQYTTVFDGQRSHLKVPTLTDDLSGGYTILGWVRWDSFNDWAGVVDFGSGRHRDNILLSNAGSTNTLALWTPGGQVTAPQVLRKGRWMHVAATVESDGTAVLYVNGETKQHWAGRVAAPVKVTRTTNYVGASNWSGAAFHGAMRDLQLWDRALRVDEIKYHMNFMAEGTELGLLHHWPMRAATVKGKRAAVDQGTAAARHAAFQAGIVSEELGADAPPSPATEFRGRLSDLQIWDVNRPVATMRDTMHDRLTGHEYGLVGYWRLGGITEEPSPAVDGPRRISPDFSAEPVDALVYGDTYESACELARENSVGRAVKFVNDELVAVTQGGRYRESFDFRVVDADGHFWSKAEVDNADGRKHRLFEFDYWGKRSRTSNETVDFAYDQAVEFVELGDGWHRAQCEITVPNGVNLIRSFGIGKVTGRWTNQERSPEDEWVQLSVRQHSLQLICDSISRRTYTDEIEMPALLEDALVLEESLRSLPGKERRISARREQLDDVLEALDAFSNRDRYLEEQAALQATETRKTQIYNHRNDAAVAYQNDVFNHRWILKGVHSGKVLDASGGHDGATVYIYHQHAGTNQVWEFLPQSGGKVKIVSVRYGRFLTSTLPGDTHAQELFLSGGDHPGQHWTVEAFGDGSFGFRNDHTGGYIDVFAYETTNQSRVFTWPRNASTNQRWWFIQPGGTRTKTNYDAEYLPLATARDEALGSLHATQARLAKVDSLLADQTAARKTALDEKRDRIEADIRALETEINHINTEYVKQAITAGSTAQTMSMVAQDPGGLKTYGAYLGFASPAGGLTSTATAEGNVQLSYFDNRGRVRLTDYDATSDSTNSAFEQWVPTTVNVAPELGSADSILELEEGSVSLPVGGNTAEAWFYYPPPAGDDGRPYPVNMLTSDAGGKESAIAIFDSRRLGLVAGGFFHDAGIDLSRQLDVGWHHVAARSQHGLTQFFIDGDRFGHLDDELRKRERHALVFDGNDGHVDVGLLRGAENDFGGGITVQAWARFDSLNNYSRIIDFSTGASNNAIIVGNVAGTGEIRFWTAGKWIQGGNVTVGEWVNIAATIEPTRNLATIYLNGREVARGEMPVPHIVDRNRNYIGRSNWPGEPYLHGAVSDLHIWKRPLSADEVRRAMFDPPVGTESGLLHHWSGAAIDKGGTLSAKDVVGHGPGHGTFVGGATSAPLDGFITSPIVAFGNGKQKGAPAGKLSELRLWATALTDEEIRVNSRIRLTGNEPDLVAYYPMNDVLPQGASARDVTGRHPSAKPAGAVPTVACTAMVGHPGIKVAGFDGVSSAITLDGVDLRNKSWTIEFWVKRKNADRQDWFVCQGPTTSHNGLHIGFREKKSYALAFYDDDLNTGLAVDGENDWLHVANVWDKAGGEQLVYVDGVFHEKRSAAPYTGTGPLTIGLHPGRRSSQGQMAEFRIWGQARSAEQIAGLKNRRLSGGESGLLAYLPLDDALPQVTPPGTTPDVANLTTIRSDDLPIVPGSSVVTAEYSTMGPDPLAPNEERAMLRRFYGVATDGGAVDLLPGKRIEELQLKWIGNAQFEPTLLGFVEGPPPAPSENLTINYDYDGATTVELRQSDEVSYSWMRNRDIGGGLDANFFLGAGFSTSLSVGLGASVSTRIAEGRIGARGSVNSVWRRNESSTIRASSTNVSVDRLDLRGAFEVDPRFPHLGNRFVPKNVGYALVVSGLADVFVLKMKRTGRMVAYEVRAVEDMPLDINTITFLINPSYQINGSLDGLVGTRSADDRFCKEVPEMRAHYGSLYPSGYFNPKQAYDLKAQIDRWDEQRLTYFTNFDARETGLSDSLLSQIPDEGQADDFGQVEITEEGEDSTDAQKDGKRQQQAQLKAAYEEQAGGGAAGARKKRAEIEKRFKNQGQQMEANAAFMAWQRRMEGLQIRAAKRNIVNTYVWDADGGLRTEEQNFANTIEHTLGGSYSLNATLGLDANVNVAAFAFELQAMGTFEMTQSLSKTASTTRTMDLNVRLDGLERKGITDAADYPLQPGEKVDRYRFMTFYLEGDTDHFHDFFDYVVDPEWLASNDEEARALRQVSSGRANKAWRVMHRVTYVERPVMMGFGRDLRTDESLEAMTEQVFNHFDALAKSNDVIKSDLGRVRTQLGQVDRKLDDLKQTAERTDGGAAPGQPAPAGPTGPGEGSPGGDGSPNSIGEAGSTGAVPLAAAAPAAGTMAMNGLLNLNRASVSDLVSLKGVGDSTARLIVELRSKLGRFTTVDQLTQVSGIGPATLEELRPLLTVADGATR